MRALVLTLALLVGCAAVPTDAKRAVATLSEYDALRDAREAMLRKHLARAWREIAIAEHRAALIAAAEGDRVGVDAAMQRLAVTLAALDKAQAVLDGFEAEARATSRGTARMRAALELTLRELERRSAAMEVLGDALEAGAEQLGEIQGRQTAADADRAEARRAAAEREGE